MAEQLTNYQCPNCNGPLHFDAELQKLKCDNCGSTFETDEIKKYYEEKNEKAVSVDAEKKQKEAAETLQWSEEEKEQLRAYNCPSCGAQLITDATTAATSCPYCGNPTVVPAQFAGDLKPDYIIPFRLKKEEAIQHLSDYYKGKPFLPNAFSSQNHIEEIKGVYVPFWLYDSEAEVHLTFEGQRSRSFATHDEQVTETDHFHVVRDGSVFFDKVPADASSKMPDILMDSIEPFDYSELKPFEMSYLPGYLADKYDVTVKDDEERAELRMHNSAIDAVRETAQEYEALIPQNEDIRIHPGTVHYAFLPVWMLATQWNGKNYLFSMNGQTGKLIGDLPVDMGKFWKTFLLITVIGAALFYILLFVVMK